MGKIGACIETVFTDLPYRDRLKRIKDIGFTHYEFWFHDKRFDGANLLDEMKDFTMFAELNEEYGLTPTGFVFNHSFGGIQGSLINKNERSKLMDNIEEMIGLAKKIGCKNLVSGGADKIPGMDSRTAVENMVEALQELAPVCEEHDITMLLEPFNSLVDHPDCFLDDPETAADVLRQVNSPNVKMLFDIYHMQIMSGNILSFVKENLSLIGHFHIAGVPGRNEPFENELDYRFIVKSIEEMGYEGIFGLEYFPLKDPEISLKETLRLFSREQRSESR